MFFSHLTALLSLSLSLRRYAAVRGDMPPTVQLDQATVYGTTNGSITSYLNIPFAEPPYAFAIAYSRYVACQC